MFLASGTVNPAWIDYNEHMMDGYYAVAFGAVTDLMLEPLGFGPLYRQHTGHTLYTVESHLVYVREVRLGTMLRYESLLLGWDAKRLHIFHTMRRDDGAVAATNELMLLHVDQAVLRAVPMAGEELARVAACAEADAPLERPAQVGRRVGMGQR